MDIENFNTGGGIAAYLQLGEQPIRTTVVDDEGEVVSLEPGDELCSECGVLITDEFRHAPYAGVLAHMRRRYGATYCRECHSRRTENGNRRT